MVFCAVGMKLLVRTLWSKRYNDCAWLYHSHLLVCSHWSGSTCVSWFLVLFAHAIFTWVDSIGMTEHHTSFNVAWHVRLSLPILLLCDCSVQCVWTGLESLTCTTVLGGCSIVGHYFISSPPLLSALPLPCYEGAAEHGHLLPPHQGGPLPSWVLSASLPPLLTAGQPHVRVR